MDLDDIGEIAIIIDENGEIIESNNKSEEYFKNDILNGDPFENLQVEENGQEIIIKSFNPRLVGHKSRIDQGRFLITFREDYRKMLDKAKSEIKEYIYAVSHDFRSPIMTIKSFSTFLEEDFSEKLGEDGKDFIDRIKNASDKMESMIEDLLKLSRIGRTEKTKIDLNAIIQSVVNDYEGKASFEIDNMPEIEAKEKWMKELFDNLIQNGLKFNKSGKKEIKIGYEKEDNKFYVKDNGVGIEEEKIDKAFKLYENTGKDNEGNGAGLTICKKIVEDHDGDIWIDSSLNEGSTVYFTFSGFKNNER